MSTLPSSTHTMPTNLSGRLRNTPLPLTSGLLPLFEAVVNSIHAIEEARVSTNDGRITITILRQENRSLFTQSDPRKKGPDALGEIIGFKIEDNGIGFTDENMASFRMLDSEHKIQMGCRGIGRLLWLKAFKQVQVKSTYQAGEIVRERSFAFSAAGGLSNEIDNEAPEGNSVSTIILETAVEGAQSVRNPRG